MFLVVVVLDHCPLGPRVLVFCQVFFGVTKLFQSQDHNLRRMMYLFIKEVAETCDPDDVIIGACPHIYLHTRMYLHWRHQVCLLLKFRKGCGVVWCGGHFAPKST